MKEFLHKNHRKILITNIIILAVSLSVIVSFSSESGINRITALSSLSEDSSNDVNFITKNRDLIFFGGITMFILDLIGIILLSTAYRPEDFMIGSKNNRYISKLKIADDFMKSVIKTESKLTDNSYTYFLLKNIKDKNKSFRYISLEMEKNGRIRSSVDQKIECISDKELKDLIELVIDRLSTSPDEKDSFRSALRYNLDTSLTKALESKGIMI